MDKEELTRLVIDLIDDQFEGRRRGYATTTVATELEKDLDCDSLDCVELAIELEAELSRDCREILLPDQELEAVVTVGDLVDLCARKLKAASRYN